MKDKYKAVWLSHSSISDFLKCPRLYYLRNIYKDPKTGHKINIITPHLALGQIVHEIVESLSVVPVEKRLEIPLTKYFEVAWGKVEGEKGGFTNHDQEMEFKARGKKMLERIEKHPGPITKKAIKLKGDGLPYYWFSEEENIILCGKIDWIQYLEKTDGIHLIDFKTGKNEEDEESLQLPIYLLLATNLQKRNVEKASYWYLETSDKLTPKKLPDIEKAHQKVEKIALRIKLARQIQHFKCPTNGCRNCIPFERILRSEGKKVGLSEYNQDLYILPK